LVFGSAMRPTLAELGELDRRQIEILGETWDGDRVGVEARFDRMGGRAFPALERHVARRDGRAVFDVWMVDIDSGIVFHAGTERVVGAIVQGGYACNDLAAWLALAGADRSRSEGSALGSVDLSIGIDTSLRLYAIAPEVRAALEADPERAHAILGAPEVVSRTVDSGWRGLALAVAPYDRDGRVARLLHGASEARIPGVRLEHGAPPWFPASEVVAIDEVLGAIAENEALERASPALAALEDADAWDVEGYRVRWARLREVVGTARSCGGGIVTRVE
jgi:hypothetical protein